MTFENLIKIAAPKVGANSAFNMAREARVKAIENLMITKGIASQQEIDSSVENEFEHLAELIKSLPDEDKK